MEDIALIIVATIAQIFLSIIFASVRPWKYVFSKPFRDKVNAEWVGRSRTIFYCYIFGGSLAILGSIAIIVFLVVLYVSPPKPTPTEELKAQLKEIWRESVRKHN